MFAYVHSRKDYERGCGEHAFLLIERPVPGTPAVSSIIRHLDGSPVPKGMVMFCESCGEGIALLHSRNVVELAES